jgi:hypothetical protein
VLFCIWSAYIAAPVGGNDRGEWKPFWTGGLAVAEVIEGEEDGLNEDGLDVEKGGTEVPPCFNAMVFSQKLEAGDRGEGPVLSLVGGGAGWEPAWQVLLFVRFTL